MDLCGGSLDCGPDNWRLVLNRLRSSRGLDKVGLGIVWLGRIIEHGLRLLRERGGPGHERVDAACLAVPLLVLGNEQCFLAAHIALRGHCIG